VAYTRPDLGLHHVGSYFNAGVLLISLAPWQQQRVAERAIEFLRNSPEKAIYLDQDALNAVLVQNWLPLDDKFNFTWRAIPHVSTPELHELVQTKTIIHFNTALKPWHRFSNGRLDYLYREYFDRSPMSRHERLHPAKVTVADIKAFLFGRLSEFYLNNAFVSNNWRRVKRLFID
jgi:lipopolysaccharide biosynthesis glycosyltransferase